MSPVGRHAGLDVAGARWSPVTVSNSPEGFGSKMVRRSANQLGARSSAIVARQADRYLTSKPITAPILASSSVDAELRITSPTVIEARPASDYDPSFAIAEIKSFATATMSTFPCMTTSVMPSAS